MNFRSRASTFLKKDTDPTLEQSALTSKPTLVGDNSLNFFNSFNLGTLFGGASYEFFSSDVSMLSCYFFSSVCGWDEISTCKRDALSDFIRMFVSAI